MSRQKSSPQASIFELVTRTHQFVRYELMHSGVGVCVFLTIFLVFKPWDTNTKYYNEQTETHPFWFVGPPLIFFILDLFFAMLLHFSLKYELRPKSCLLWVTFQILNLILLTFTGFYMVWNYYYRGNTYLRLVLALLVLYCYKSYRISKMHKLISEMVGRCEMTIRMNSTVDTLVNNNNLSTPGIPEKVPYMISIEPIGSSNSTF